MNPMPQQSKKNLKINFVQMNINNEYTTIMLVIVREVLFEECTKML